MEQQHIQQEPDQQHAIENMKAYLYDKEKEIERLQQWVNDLQSGMYVNCVYCGHRYGKEDEVPATMADALKEHVEQCPEHPMSKIKQKYEKLESQAVVMRDTLDIAKGYIREDHSLILGLIMNALCFEAGKELLDKMNYLEGAMESEAQDVRLLRVDYKNLEANAAIMKRALKLANEALEYLKSSNITFSTSEALEKNEKAIAAIKKSLGEE